MVAALPPGTNLGQPGEWRMWTAYSHSLAMTLAPIERSRAAISKAMDLTAGDDDVDLRADLLHVQWSVEFTSGAHRAALIAARKLATVTSHCGDAMRLAGDRILGASLLVDGKLTDAQDCLQRVVDLYVAPPDGHHSTLFRRDPQVLARVKLARVLSLRGYLDRAYAEARSSFEAAQSSGSGVTVCWAAHEALCPIALMTGDVAAAEDAIAAMSDWATRLDATLWKMMATCWKGRLLVERGEFARGIELISQHLEACERTGWHLDRVQFLGWLADGLAALGHRDEAGAKLEHAIAWADHSGEGWYRAELMRMKGELLVQRSLANEAEDCFRAALQIAREQDALFWELRIALSLARLRATQGRHDDARQVLAPVHARFTEGIDTPDLRAAKALLG
jgi:tetratricopeptide (TPR) repeat protein